MDTATQEFAPVSEIDEGSFAPEFWQNITCADEVPVDYYFDDKKYFHNDKDMELSYFDQDPSLAHLEFSTEIPDMECYKETSSACAERKRSWIICHYIRIRPFLLERIRCYLWPLLYATSSQKLHLKTCWRSSISTVQTQTTASPN